MPGQSHLRTTQNLRNFTVKIRHASTHQTVGTGFIVSRGGRIVTCAHVVLAAGIVPRSGRPVPDFWSLLVGAPPAGPGEVEVFIPGDSARKGQTCRGSLHACFPDHDDDVVLLQLVGEFVPLTDDQVAVLAPAGESEGHSFRSYGYRRLDTHTAGWADGKILGVVEAPEGAELQAELIQLQSDGINRGMSGAAVLDVDRNLVVGVISEAWFPDASMKDRLTAWAVDARVLNLEPLEVELRQASPESSPLSEPEMLAVPRAGSGWTGVPPAPEACVGRDDMLQQLTTEWTGGTVKLTSIIGFGGEGKSTLVRRWLDVARPESAFWWTFTDSNLDNFFATARRHLAGSSFAPGRVDHAHLLAALLSTGRHVLILDGLEALQFHGGDCEGLLKSQDLARFLRYAGSPSHSSFCILTSRLAVADLIDLPTCTSHNLSRLPAADGRDLLRKLGVTGPDPLLEQAAEQWNGHALTLRLLGIALREKYAGNIASSGAVATVAELPRDQQVDRLLAFYDGGLDQRQHQVLWALSLFRIPPPPSVLATVLRAAPDELQDVLDGLTQSQIVRSDPEGACLLHPFVRAHYSPPPQRAPALHFAIARFYLNSPPIKGEHPTLPELSPLIEAVHHLCGAGRNVEAHNVFERGLMRGDRKYLLYELCAPETVLNLAREIYFPEGDIARDPLPDSAPFRSSVLSRVGNSLLMLGRLKDAAGLFQRAIVIDLELQDWHNSSVDYRNLVNVLCSLGELTEAHDAAAKALSLSQRAHNSDDERTSLAWQAWVAHLQGRLAAAGDLFLRAEKLEYPLNPAAGLVQLRGVQHAIHLRRTGEHARARIITENNLRYSEEANAPDNVSSCHAVLGDLAADRGALDDAEFHYAEAIRIARETGSCACLLAALGSRAAWLARAGSLDRTLRDAGEGLDLAVPGGYRITEADFRTALAVAYQLSGDRDSARAQASRSLEICAQTGYFWASAESGSSSRPEVLC